MGLGPGEKGPYGSAIHHEKRSWTKYHPRGLYRCQVPGCLKVFAYETSARRHERRDHKYFRTMSEHGEHGEEK